MLDLVMVRSHLQSGLRWWTTELGALVPLRLRRRFAWDSDRIVVEISGERVSVLSARVTARAPRLLMTGDAAAVGHFLTAEGRRLARLHPLVLRVPLSRCLVRDVSMPRAALHRAEAVLALDLERATPFKRGDVFSGHMTANAEEHAVVPVRHVVFKREAAAPIIAALAEANVAVAGVEVSDADGVLLPLRLTSADFGSRKPPLLRRLDRITGGLALACVMAAASAVGVSIWQDRTRLATTERRVSELQKRAVQLRQRLSADEKALVDAASLRARRTEAMSVVSLLEEITRILPDSAHLSELQLADGFVIIDGMARQAADLVGLLAASSRFGEVGFAAPVTRDSGRGLERFRIRLRLNGDKGKP